MSYNVAYRPDLQLVEVVLEGEIDVRQVINACQEAYEIGVPYDCKLFLVDGRLMLPGPSNSSLDIYSLQKLFATLDNERTLKEALILPPFEEMFAGLQFFAAAVQHEGFDVRLFREYEAGLAWLMT